MQRFSKHQKATTENRRPIRDTGFQRYALDSSSVPPSIERGTPAADAASDRGSLQRQKREATR